LRNNEKIVSDGKFHLLDSIRKSIIKLNVAP
jgi:hypothetical protein